MDALDDPQRSEVDARIGKVVDSRYRIIEAMASGSMGAVYKAEREPVGKLVAIKFLHSSFAKDSEFLSRFERETRVMSKLAHPNCVSVVDFGVWEGAPYLAMEYVAGKTLRALLDEEERLPVQRALLLARQIAAGLAHAHAQGITHRDVKPANIMITDEVGHGDHVRILDFGLARLRGAVGRDATQTNVVVGTPNYMAPEQTIGGGTIDARTDVYAVGVVLFEMIAGVRPFAAEDTLQLLGMHRAAPVPKLADRMGEGAVLPDGLQQLVEKALAKLPDQRFQSAIELSAAIDKVLGPRTTGTQEVPLVVASRAPEDAAVAPTLVDVASDKIRAERIAPVRAPASSFPTLLMLVVLVGGAGAAVWYTQRGGAEKSSTPTAAPVPPPPPPPRVASGSAVPVDARATGSAAAVVPPADAAEPPAPEIDAAAEIDAPWVFEGPGEGEGSGSAAGSAAGSANDEIEMDPMVATNPDPNADNNDAEDEAADAPETAEDVAKRVPAAPVRASTVAQAVQMIKDGKRDLALASLQALWKKSPNSAYIPFLLGNLYNDRLWWSIAMDHYTIAIKKNAAYRGNAVLNKNVIKMLGSPKTARKAELFLRGQITRRYALPYLKWAAKNEKHPVVRKAAARLAKSIR